MPGARELVYFSRHCFPERPGMDSAMVLQEGAFSAEDSTTRCNAALSTGAHRPRRSTVFKRAAHCSIVNGRPSVATTFCRLPPVQRYASQSTTSCDGVQSTADAIVGSVGRLGRAGGGK